MMHGQKNIKFCLDNLLCWRDAVNIKPHYRLRKRSSSHLGTSRRTARTTCCIFINATC